MKKTVIITAVALGLSLTTLNAKTSIANFNSLELIKTKPSVSPFIMSIVKGDIETVKKLIDLGVDVNEKYKGMTPAMYAAKFNKVEILKLLVDKGANLKVKSEKGFNAGNYAQQSNAKEVLIYLAGLKS